MPAFSAEETNSAPIPSITGGLHEMHMGDEDEGHMGWWWGSSVQRVVSSETRDKPFRGRTVW
jgi:hypothetical protein